MPKAIKIPKTKAADAVSPAVPAMEWDGSPTCRFLRTPEAGAYLGLSARTLEKHRTYGTGPVYRKLGNRVVYAIEELNAWAEIGTRWSTSDPGSGIVNPAKWMTPHDGKAGLNRRK